MVIQPRQLPLFPDIPSEADKGSFFSDPSFATNKVLPIHRWVPWIAGFSSSFVSDILRSFLQDTGVVLDPFCGVGTTLVEAMLLGHQAVGFEINPYAALACRVKAGAYYTKLLWSQETPSRKTRAFSMISFKPGDAPVNRSAQGLPGCSTSHSDFAWL